MNEGNGVLTAVVSNLDDPHRFGRVEVTLAVRGNIIKRWARVVGPTAGRERGNLFRPEVDDEVLVVAEGGDLHRLYVLGGFWSSHRPPPPVIIPNAENNVRTIISRSGHALTFDDTPNRERLELVDKSGKRAFRIDCFEGHVTITAEGSGDTIAVSAPGGAVHVKAANAVDIESTTGSVTLSAPAGTVTLKGARISLDAGQIDIAGTPVRVDGSGTVTATADDVKTV